MARWTASAEWAAGPALAGQRDMPLALRLSEGLGVTVDALPILSLVGLKPFSCAISSFGSKLIALARLRSPLVAVTNVFADGLDCPAPCILIVICRSSQLLYYR